VVQAQQSNPEPKEWLPQNFATAGNLREKNALISRRKGIELCGSMSTENELIDWEQLDMMADGYTPDFVEIYREFLEQTPGLFTRLENHLAAGDLHGAKDAAHKIKGSAANFGFLGVSAPMARLEHQIKEAEILDGGPIWLREARENFERSQAEVREKRGI